MATSTPQAPAPATAGDLPDPKVCERCHGAGTVEHCIFGAGVIDVRCPGVDDDGSCDDGLVRA